MNKMVKQSDWATETLMEAPYWRNGMSPEEYEQEREYFNKNFNNYLQGKYIPLWKQEEEKKLEELKAEIFKKAEQIPDSKPPYEGFHGFYHSESEKRYQELTEEYVKRMKEIAKK